MIRELAWLLIATAAGCALLLVGLLAWHEFSGRATRNRYRAAVSANRLAIKQEQREHDARLLAELDRRFGHEPQIPRPGRTVVYNLTLDTTKWDESIQHVRDACKRAGI